MLWGALSVAFLLSGCVSKTELYPDGQMPGVVKTVSVAHLKSAYTGYATPLKEEWEIRGTVTATDRYGSFPNQLVVQDATGGIAVKAGADELFLAYPIGEQLAVRCKGLVLGGYGGEVNLGAVSSDPAYQNGFIPDEEVPARLRKSGPFEPLLPDTLRIAQLDARHVGCFVAFEEVEFADSDLQRPWSDPDADSDRLLVDRDGHTLIVRTSRHADFAARLLPSGSGYIEGILGYFNKSYQLRVVTSQNVLMTSPRFVPGSGSNGHPR